MVDREPFVAVFAGDRGLQTLRVAAPAEQAALQVLAPDLAVAPGEAELPEIVVDFDEGREQALEFDPGDPDRKVFERRQRNHVRTLLQELKRGASAPLLDRLPA